MMNRRNSGVLIAVGAVFLAVVITVCSVANASRNSGGTYSLATPGNPVVSGTTITTSWANNTLSDLATEMTDSLSRSGKGGMLAPLRTTDGSVSSPSHSFTSEAGSGFYRIGTNDVGLAIGGVKVIDWTASVQSLTVAGSATSIPSTIFEASLANGNSVRQEIGIQHASNQAGTMSFTPNATAALSTLCVGIAGVNDSTLCVDGNQKTTAAGALAVTGAATLASLSVTGTTNATGLITATGGVKFGSVTLTNLDGGLCTLDGGSPSHCTATVHAGATCNVSINSTGTTTHVVVSSVSSTTLTITGPNAATDAVNFICIS